MATNYVLLATTPRTQVLSPTLAQPVVDCTLQTIPTGVIFNYWVDRAVWDAGDSAPLLEAVAGNVEHIIAATPAVSGTGFEQLQPSGLLRQYVTFTVATTTTGSVSGEVTIDVVVPVSDLDQDTIAGENFGLTAAIDAIDAGYQQLLAAAAG